jgi:tRNA-specific 2-thiouridylase
LRWISREPAELSSGGTLRCAVKTRYRQADISCEVHKTDGDRVEVRFDSPQWAVTPGQYAVFYLADECLGGGAIESAVSQAS